MEEKKKKFKFKVPHVYALLMIVMFFCAVLTWIVPAGTYDMVVNESGRSVVDPTTYHRIEQTPVGIVGYLGAIFDGMIGGAEIIFLVFVCGGAFGIVFETGAIHAGVVRVALAMRGKERGVIPILMALFCFMGCTMGAAEDLVIYIPIVLTLSLALGFDSITAVGMVTVAAAAGFTGSFMNPYTVGVAQGICELPLFSASVFRMGMLAAFFLSAVIYVMRYAAKIKKDPTLSPMYEFDKTRQIDISELENTPFTGLQKIIVLLFFVIVVLLVFGTLKWGWWYKEICALFLGYGLVAALLSKMSFDDFGRTFAKGMADITSGALVIGVARGILIVLQDGNIIHTILYGCSVVLDGMPIVVAAEGMYIVQCLMDYLIPSGSGQAAVTMPLMAPLADVLGVTRQTACVAYQMGDGFSNSFSPTSGSLMAVLGVCQIPWDKWARFQLPLICIWYVIGAVVIAIAVAVNLGPF